jgi:hypothetical protein
MLVVMQRAAVVTAIVFLLPLVASAKESAERHKLKQADRKLQAEINLAIRKGRDWLLGQQDDDGSFPHPYAPYFASGGTALSMLTLLHCGVKPEDRRIRKGFDFLRTHYERVKEEPLSGASGLKVYETAVTIMALAQLGTDEEEGRGKRGSRRVGLDKSDLRWMQKMTDWLVEHQSADGGWGYPVPSRTDPSNSQYALLALKEARRMKMQVPAQVFTKALDFWVDRQEKSGPKVRRYEEEGGDGVFDANRTVARVWDHARGWGYRGSGPYGSMTAAGVAAMAIVRSELRSRRQRIVAERSMHDGMAWLGQYFSVTTNPGPGNPGRHHYYYLYGLERAGVLGEVVWMGEHRWYAEGARILVDAQKRDGSWPTNESSARGVVDPCFALLFLVRSTTHSYGLTEVTPQGPVDLVGGDELPDEDFAALFEEAFAEMFRLGEGLRKARASDFARLGPSAIGLLLPKLSAPEEIVRDRAILVLRLITGKQMGYDAAASEKVRETAISRWTKWYMANRQSLALDAEAGLISGESEASQIAVGSVGETGASKVLTLRVDGTSKQVVLLRNTQSSLCGSTGAVAQLVVNGEPKAQGDLTKEGSSLKIEAQPGDRVVATVNTIPLDNGIVCARLGELHFVLEVCAPADER